MIQFRGLSCSLFIKDQPALFHGQRLCSPGRKGFNKGVTAAVEFWGNFQGPFLTPEVPSALLIPPLRPQNLVNTCSSLHKKHLWMHQDITWSVLF